MRKYFLSILILFSFFASTRAQQAANTFTIGQSDFLLNNKPIVIRCGEMHLARIPREYWRHRLQMAKAMGLNAVCAYLFWNYVEQSPGDFNWSGMADAAEFCRIAQQEGLWVILRPGPYSCAEWEMGGFPSWLLKKKDIKLRTQDEYYLERCHKYLLEVGKQLAPLQITNGGPIIMVQVENEYGSYGNDRAYLGKLTDYIKEANFNVPLFTCDGPSQLKNDVRDDLFPVVNFGNDPEGCFKALREIRKTGPLMCGEFYPGWFDSWGNKHHYGSTDAVIKDVEYMLRNKESFSIYMVHGGTSFGFWSGANCPPYLPQTSSYDYDAPISEAGNATPKFYELRNLFSKYLQEGETLPEVPKPIPAMSIAAFSTTEVARLFANLPKPALEQQIKTMEGCDQAFGSILYRTNLPEPGGGEVQINEVHDYAYVYLNGKKIATVDRSKGQSSFIVPKNTAKGAVLDILVEAMGRINFGAAIHDRKGITDNVLLKNANGKEQVLNNWKIYSIDLKNNQAPLHLNYKQGKTSDAPAFYRGKFVVKETKDTYLDVSKWGKGVVWINGICIGRYWNIGPTQTMYLPGVWLKKGENEIVVLDYFPNKGNTLRGSTTPILDSVTLKTDNLSHRKKGETILLGGVQPVYGGTFTNDKEWQTINFNKAFNGRYVCLEALNAQNNDPYTTIAELYFLDEQMKEIPHTDWKVLYADSEETSAMDCSANNVFDIQRTTFWHTAYKDGTPSHPHQVVIDLGSSKKIGGFKYLPRQDMANGRIKDYKVYVSNKLFPGLK
ncbi:beta-galactosidase [Chitinophagaceae bacterium 26-R-25]|nr:beta-galactosidase [Chitinophagaceae bacterium 26-R-25]